MPATMYDIAQSYLEAGLSFFPTREKQPAFDLLPKRYNEEEKKKKHTWVGYQKRQPYPEELKFWYEEGRATELALVCGNSSNGNIPNAGLFIIDLDRPELISSFRDACGPHWAKVAIQRTRKSGLHLAMLCDGAAKLTNKKLALRDNPEYVSFKVTPKIKRYLCDIETRGAGGYACAWPTPNYTLEQRDFTHLPWVDMDDVVWPLLQAAMSFNQVDLAPSIAAVREVRNELPGTLSLPMSIIQEFRRRYTVTDMLLHYGYTAVTSRRFKRPGGRSGSCLVAEDNGICVAFSSSDILNQKKNSVGGDCHDSFSILTQIEHEGDVKAALEAVAPALGMTYHQNNYSDQREDLHTTNPNEIAFYAGDEDNDTIFLVDDTVSASILSEQGCAVLFTPSGTTEIGGWTSKVLQFEKRYAWMSEHAIDGAAEMLMLSLDAKIVPCPWTAAELWEKRNDVDRFVTEVTQFVGQATLPQLKMSARIRR